jgi:hypothetical protein
MTSSDSLIELCYSRWSGHYSKKNWISNQPLWSELSEEDQKWWKEYIVTIRTPVKKYIDATEDAK